MPTYVLIAMIIIFGCLMAALAYSFKTSTEIKEENDPQEEEIETFYIFSIGVERTEKFKDFMAAKKFARENPYLLCRKNTEFKWVPAHKRFGLNDCYVFRHPNKRDLTGYFYDEKAKEFALKHPFYMVAWVDFDQPEKTPLKWEKLGTFFNMNH